MDEIKIYEEYILKSPTERDEYLKSIVSHLNSNEDLLLNHILETRPYSMTKEEETRHFNQIRQNVRTDFRLKKILIDLQTLSEDPRRFKDYSILSDDEKKVRSSSLKGCCAALRCKTNKLQRLTKLTTEERIKELVQELQDYHIRANIHHTRKVVSEEKKGQNTEENIPKEDVPTYKTLDEEELVFGSIEDKMTKIYAIKNESKDDNYVNDQQVNVLLGQIGRKNWHLLDLKKVKIPTAKKTIVEGLTTFKHIPSLGSTLSGILSKIKKINGGYEVHYGDIYKNMDLDELEEVSKAIGTYESYEVHVRRFEIIFFDHYDAISKTENEEELFELFKKFKSEVDNKKSSFTKRGFLSSVGNMVFGGWDPYLGALSRVLNKCMLLNTIRRDSFDEQLFLEYMEKPLESWFTGMTEKFQKKYSGYCSPYQCWHQFVNNYSNKMTCATMVDQCLDILLKNESDIKRFSKMFETEYLQKKYFTNLAKKGQDMAKLRELIGLHSASELENRKCLEIIDKNLSYFGDKPIELKIKIKNLKHLELRAYEFDIASYLKQSKTEPPIDVDLDGLVPMHQRKLTYDYLPQQEHIKSYLFPELDQYQDGKYKRGFFIIDIIGNSMMSRAIIRRGTLSLVQLPHQYGYKLFIVDENKDICKGPNTGIYVEDRFLAAAEDGSIVVSFEKSEKTYECILSHGSFAMKSSYTIGVENYQLEGALIFNEESFVSGRIAKILVRLRLKLNGVPVSLKKLRDPQITLNTQTISMLTNTKIFDGLNLGNDRDACVELLVPNGLNMVNITFDGWVETINNPKLGLTFSEHFEIDRRLNSEKFQQIFLIQKPVKIDQITKKTQSKSGILSHNYLLELRGRNGEPIVQERLNVAIRRATDCKVQNSIVDTDKTGNVNLGDLSNVESIKVSGKFGEQIWKVSSFNTSSLKLKSDFFKICEGEDLILPSLSHEIDSSLSRPYELTRVNSLGKFLTDNTKNVKIQGLKIFISGLKKGTYKLTYYTKGEFFQVGICVLDAKRWKYDQIMLQHPFHLEHVTGELNFLNIDQVTQSNQELVIQTTSNDPENVSIHVMAHLHTPITRGYMEQQLRGTRNTATHKQYELNKVTNQFFNNRAMGDELKYVIDRQNKPAQIGNTLEKPSLLLHRKFIKETTEDQEVLNKGDNFDLKNAVDGIGTLQGKMDLAYDSSILDGKKVNRGRRQLENAQVFKKKGFIGGIFGGKGARNMKMKAAESEVMRAPSSMERKQQMMDDCMLGDCLEDDDDIDEMLHDYENQYIEEEKAANQRRIQSSIPECQMSLNFVQDYEYISDSGLVLENLKPDENGVVRVPLEQLKGYSQLTIFAADVHGTDIATYLLNQPTIKKNEMRLDKAKAAGVGYTEERSCCVGRDNQQVLLVDLKNTQSLIVGNLKDVFDSLMTVCYCDQDEVLKWKFLATWNILSKEKKQEKWDEFGGDELNCFLFMKDRVFFEEYIKPILSFKTEFTLTDRILTGHKDTLKHLVEPSIIATLSPLHVALLLIQTQDSSLNDKIAGLIKDVQSTIAVNDTLVKLYDSILASKPQDEPAGFDDGQNFGDFKKQAVVMDCFALGDYEERDECDGFLADCQKDQEDEGQKKKKKKKEKKKSERILGDNDGDQENGESQNVVIKKYQEVGKAKEYGERDRWFKQTVEELKILNCTTPSNRFWLEILSSVISGTKGLFLSENFMPALMETSYNIVYLLAFLELGFEKLKVESQKAGKDLVLKSKSTFLVVCKRIEEKHTQQLKMDIIVSQKFYDPQDKYKYDEQEPELKTMKQVEEFLIDKIYCSEITITNTSENTVRLKLISQIPEGSLPVEDLDELKLEDITLSSMSTQIKSFKFYFPQSGKFDYYPATIMSRNLFVCHAPKKPLLKVLEKFVRGNKTMESLQDILNYGTKDMIVNFMKEKNLHNPRIFKSSSILWMLQEEPYYRQIIGIMRQKGIFDASVWSYCIKHNDLEALKEFLYSTDFFKNSFYSFLFVRNRFYRLDRFKTLEYDPLINPRAHGLTETKQSIRNKDFRETYLRFLKYCCNKARYLDNREWIILAGYLTLQDRTKEAQEVVKKVNPQEVEKNGTMQVQYDYLKAYLAIFSEFPHFNTTRDIVERYSSFSDISWRKRFAKVKEQLMEYDGLQEIKDEELEEDKKIRHRSNQILSKKTEYFKVELSTELDALDITHMNIDEVELKYYALDLELVFSKDPFLDANLKNISFLHSQERQTVKLTSSLPLNSENQFDSIPTSMKFKLPSFTKPHVVYIGTKNFSKSEVIKVFPAKFKAEVISQVGIIKIRSKLNNRLIPGAYVKVFAKFLNENVPKFYKDGYSDFTGAFDYSSLNSGILDKVEKFSILVKVVSEEEGGEMVLDAQKPGTCGEVVFQQIRLTK